MHNPFTDTLTFLAGQSPDYNPFGATRYLMVVFYLALLAGSGFIARRNWQRDPQQRTAHHISIWLMRVLAAGMWYQGTMWKVPLPVSDAFTFWVGALAKFTPIAAHAAIVKAVLLPYIALFQPLVWLTEMAFTIALTLGLFVRFFALLAVAFTAHLWIGLYNDPTEWPWTYIGIIVTHGMFAATGAGRSLGLDNLLRLNRPALFTRYRVLGRFAEVAS